MKKKRALLIVIAICIIVVLTVAGFVFYKPVPIIASPYTIANNNESYSKSDVVISTVYYDATGIDFNRADISDRIDKEKFVAILSNYKCRRSFNNPFPYPSADMIWEINLVQDFKPVHIVLGKDSVRYEDSSSIVMYKIINPESLMKELETVILR